MATPLTYLRHRTDAWLIGVDSTQFRDQVERRSQHLKLLLKQGIMPRVLIAESDPVAFLAGFMAACVAECPVFLGNPQWAEAEWQQVWQIVQPHLVWSDCPEEETVLHRLSPPAVENYLNRQLKHFAHQNVAHQIGAKQNFDNQNRSDRGWIMIPTGGSSGQIRFVIHTWQTLMASVQGFQQHFQVEHINSCCVLPLYHVSGLMQFLRSFATQGQLAIVPFKGLKSGAKPELSPTQFFLSLVPTQLQQLLQNSELTDWLKQFQTVLLGGAPASHNLLEMARQHKIRLAPTYGMTETASQVATLLPQKFLLGHYSSGKVLPHAQITIFDSNHQHLNSNQVGKVVIQADSLALGYYPNRFDQTNGFITDDIGFLDPQGALNIIGRNSEKIITGGENVFPAEVESAILTSGLVSDVCVFGVPDSEWGEVVIAVYVPKHPEISSLEIQGAIAHQLSRFKHPKRWIEVLALPRNQQGKINRQQLITVTQPIH